MSLTPLIVIAATILVYGLLSGRLERSILTGPMIFVSVGYLTHASGLVSAEGSDELIDLLAELTLVLVLFTDASRIDLGLLRRQHDLPVRLLLIGLPLTIGLGTLAALWVLPGMKVWDAAVLAALLAPTDAALGQAVVGSSRVPVRMRQALNVESGLNDGVVLPLVLILLSAACATEHTHGALHWIRFSLLQVTVGPLVGALVGYFGGKAIERAAASGTMTGTFVRLSALGLALFAFAAAEVVHGNGFIAAFVAGLAMGNFAQTVCSKIHSFGEAEGQLLSLLVFLVFGAMTLPTVLPELSVPLLLYAGLSLTVVRMVPVSLALLGTGLHWPSHLFLGWFGPRGLASILFALRVVHESVLSTRGEILNVVMATVAISVFAHGLTAYPGANRYASALARRPDNASMEESREVTPMPLRMG